MPEEKFSITLVQGKQLGFNLYSLGLSTLTAQSDPRLLQVFAAALVIYFYGSLSFSD